MEKALNASEVNYLVEQIKPLIVNNHITNVSIVNSSDLLFSFSFLKNKKLLVSINHATPLFGLINVSENTPTILGQFNDVFRNEIKNTFVIDIESIKNDRIIKLTLQSTDEFYEKHLKTMIVELIPHQAKILILDKDNKVIFSSRYTTLTDRRLILKGVEYTLPNAPTSYVEEIRNNLEEEISEYYYSSLETRNKEKYSELGETIKKKLKSCKKKVAVLENEIKLAEDKLIYQEYGNMLLTYQNDKETRNNYILENNIEYDYSKSLNDNVAFLFKKYKKAKSTILNCREQLSLNEKLIKEIEIDNEIYLTGDENKIILLKNKYPKLIKGNNILLPSKQMPYYFEINGTKYAFGKNNEQNDFLTFKIAKANHHFFHIKDYHGSHVVILKDHPKEEEYLLAAELAIYASGKDIGEVQYAQIKDIKKSHNAGLVILEKYKTINIKKIDDVIKQGFKNPTRFSF